MDVFKGEERGVSRSMAAGAGGAFRDSYREPDRAAAYRDRFRRGTWRRLSDRRERAAVRRLVERACPPGGLVLDVPSGCGRLLEDLERGQEGRRVVAGDASLAMLRLCGPEETGSGMPRREGSSGGCERVALSAFALPFPDRSFDCVVCVRFLHHFRGAGERLEVLRSLRRVTRDAAVVSFFSSLSVQGLRRCIRRLRGRRSARWAGTPGRFAREARQAGFRVEGVLHSFRGWSEWAVALLHRADPGS